MHCRDRGISVYIDFGNCRLYSCDIDFYKAHLQYYGLSKIECDELFGDYEHLTSQELENIRKKYKEMKKQNLDVLKEQKKEDWQLLKKYYPDFAKTIEEDSRKKDNEVTDKKKKDTEEYFRILYPEYDELSLQEQARLEYDRSILYENIDEINSFFESYSKKHLQELDNKELIEIILTERKIDKYFKLMCPEYDVLPPTLQFKLLFERDFIEEHLEEIDLFYKECKEQNSKTQMQDMDEREIVQTIINNIKEQIEEKKKTPKLQQARDRKTQAEQKRLQALELKRKTERALDKKKGRTEERKTEDTVYANKSR